MFVYVNNMQIELLDRGFTLDFIIEEGFLNFMQSRFHFLRNNFFLIEFYDLIFLDFIYKTSNGPLLSTLVRINV